MALNHAQELLGSCVIWIAPSGTLSIRYNDCTHQPGVPRRVLR